MAGTEIKVFTVVRERFVPMRQVLTIRAASGEEALIKAAAASWKGEAAQPADEGGLCQAFEGDHENADAARDARAVEHAIPYSLLHRNDRNERLLEGLMGLLDRLVTDAKPDLEKEVRRLRLLAEGKHAPEDLDA